jgi:hypothetical protein
MECLAQLQALLRWALRVRQPRPWRHVHTASPALGSPWCPGCDALLTEAIAHDEARKEKR